MGDARPRGFRIHAPPGLSEPSGPSLRPPPLRRDADAPLTVDEFAIPTVELRLQGDFVPAAVGLIGGVAVGANVARHPEVVDAAGRRGQAVVRGLRGGVGEAGERRGAPVTAQQAGREATAGFGGRGHVGTLPQPKPPIIPNPPPQPPSKIPATPKRPNPPPRPPAKEWVPPRPPR